MGHKNTIGGDMLESVLALADGGRTSGEIARKLGLNTSTVYGILSRNGYLQPKQRDETVVVMRKGRPVRLWTRAEDALIVRLRVEGLRIVQIAARFEAEAGYRRNQHCIGIRLKMLSSLEDGGLGVAA